MKILPKTKNSIIYIMFIIVISCVWIYTGQKIQNDRKFHSDKPILPFSRIIFSHLLK